MSRAGDTPELVAENEELRKQVAELEELRKRIAELEAEYDELFVLQQVFATLNSTLNIDDILSTVLRGIHEALRFRRVVLFDVQQGTIRRRLETGPDGLLAHTGETTELRMTAALRRILERGLDFHVGTPDDEQSPIDAPRGEFCMLSLVSRDTVRGVLYVDDAPTGQISDSHVRMLLNFANQAAIALENARLYGETKRLLEVTQRLAATDPLTGLANRRALEDLLEHEIHNSSRHGHTLAYAIFDLDDLKKINDSQGHAGGDAALRNFANVIKAGSRRGDIVARYAGDEFVLVMSQTNRAAAQLGIERIFQMLEREGIRSTVGIAMLPADGTTERELFYAADEALYEAKKRGKNRFLFHDGIQSTGTVLIGSE